MLNLINEKNNHIIFEAGRNMIKLDLTFTKNLMEEDRSSSQPQLGQRLREWSRVNMQLHPTGRTDKL